MADIRYFLYSKEQYDECKKLESIVGRKYKVGKVMVKGQYENFTELSDRPVNRYKDCKVVIKGDPDTTKHTKPESI